MKFKSLLIAATMVGGMALGASAANAADAALWTVTGGGPAIDGSFEYTSSSELGITPGGNEFLSAFDGTGAYAGINEFSLTSLAGEGYPPRPISSLAMA